MSLRAWLSCRLASPRSSVAGISRPQALFIQGGGLDRTKQHALYVELEGDEVRTPSRVTREKALGLLAEVPRAITECGDVGFNGFDCDSTALSQARAAEKRQMATNAFAKAQNQVRAVSSRRQRKPGF